MTDPERRRDWTYQAATNDWPTGVGTHARAWSRRARYRVLRSFPSVFDAAMRDLAATPDPAAGERL